MIARRLKERRQAKGLFVRDRLILLSMRRIGRFKSMVAISTIRQGKMHVFSRVRRPVSHFGPGSRLPLVHLKR